jgi:acyl-CoA reductase-like NAD-dependent aldehyde dehydrogenase
MPSELAPAAALDGGVLCNHIDGAWTLGADGRTAPDHDPSDPASALLEVTESCPADAEAALHAAATAQPGWAATSPIARGQILLRAAGIVRERSAAVARALTVEEGKPLAEAIAEVLRAADVLEAFAGFAYLPTGEVFGRRRREQWLLTDRVPLGVVTVIAPWNFPFLIPAWKIAPALLAGNTVVFKPAGLTPVTAAHLVDALVEAGLPPGALNLVTGPGGILGAALVRGPAAAVSFTGGNDTGAAIAQRAVAGHLKFQLELGGNNPVLVMPDADLDLTVREIVVGAIGSTGQKCTATRRVYVHGAVQAELTVRLRAALGEVRLGPGLDPATTVGPLVSAAALREFEEAAERLTAIASVERFGRRPEAGHFAAPALAVGGDPDHALFRDEVFGPLLSLFEVADLQEGIARCNDTPFGLSASLFSSRLATALEFADGVAAGMVHVNSQTTGSEPHLPFGGMKRSSSFSREVGRHGLEFFSQVKTVYLEGT